MYATHNPLLRDYTLPNRTMLGRVDERERSSILSSLSKYGSESMPISRTIVEEGSNSSRLETTPPHHAASYGRVPLRNENRHLSPPQAGLTSSSYARMAPPVTNLISDFRAAPSQQAAPRPQMRFDPFTGEPYKFDPFTGEPIIHPGNNPTHQF